MRLINTYTAQVLKQNWAMQKLATRLQERPTTTHMKPAKASIKSVQIYIVIELNQSYM